MTGTFRTSLGSVPPVGGLSRDDGWVDMQVQFLIDNAGAASDEFFIVLSGSGEIYTDEGTEPAAEGDVVWTPRGHWHGFDNTGDEDVVLVWGWSGCGSLEDSGYEVDHGPAG